MNISNSVVNVGQQDVQTQGNPGAPVTVGGPPAPGGGLGGDLGPGPPPAGPSTELPPFRPIGDAAVAPALPPLGDTGGPGAMAAPPPMPGAEPGLAGPPDLGPAALGPADLGPPELEPSPIGPSWNPSRGAYE